MPDAEDEKVTRLRIDLDTRCGQQRRECLRRLLRYDGVVGAVPQAHGTGYLIESEAPQRALALPF